MIITMKMTEAFAFVACCVLGYFCGQSDAFECYSCTSATDKNCGDPFSSGAKEDNCAMCRKGKAKAEGNGVVLRSCLLSATGVSTGCTSNSAGDACFCDSALCNASTRASMETALLFLLPAFILYLNK